MFNFTTYVFRYKSLHKLIKKIAIFSVFMFLYICSVVNKGKIIMAGISGITSFGSAPVGGKIIAPPDKKDKPKPQAPMAGDINLTPTSPQKPTYTPLAGLITPPKLPKPPYNPNYPIGGLITPPNLPKMPMPKPTAGLISPPKKPEIKIPEIKLPEKPKAEEPKTEKAEVEKPQE